MAGSPRVTAIIDAKDLASPTIQKVMREAMQAQSRYGRTMPGVLRQAKEAQAAMVAAQNAHAAAIERANAGLLKTRELLAGIAAIKLGEIAFKGLKEGALARQELQRMAAAGIKRPEIKALDSQAAHLGGEILGLTRSEMLETARELHSILLRPEKETSELLPAVLKAKQAMENMGGVHGDATSITPVIRALESLGLTQSPQRFEAALESFTKAQQVFGSHFLNPDTYRESVLNAGSSAQFWSDEFRNKYFPTLVQELQGRAGTGLGMLAKQITGTMADSHGALKEMLRLGLVGKRDVDYLKTGEAKALKAGQHVIGYEEMARDPVSWVRKFFKPALEKAGITKDEDIASEIRKIFPNKSASSIVAKVLEQLPQLDKDAANITNASGFKAVNPDNALFALSALEKSLLNFGATLTSPIMADAAHAMNTVASNIGRFGAAVDDFNKSHPTIAKAAAGGAIVGGTALGVGALQAIVNRLSGAGAVKIAAADLASSALALDKAAAALEAAAGTQKAAGATSATVKAEGAAAAAGGAAAKTEGATGAAKPSVDPLAWRKWAFALGGLGVGLDAGMTPVGSKEWADRSNALNHFFDRLGEYLPKGWVSPSQDVKPFDPAARPPPPPPAVIREVDRGANLPPKLGDWGRARNTLMQVYGGRPNLDAELLRETSRARALSAQAPIQVHVEPISVQGTLSGEVNGRAEVHAIVNVEASAMLEARLRHIDTMAAELRGAAHASVGGSMQGSNAPPRAIHGGGIGHQ